ncbi:MAG: DUF1275 family protein [Bordetella sp.]|nr:DUF1275 family protein [Bordetella sp.]
MDQAPSPRFGLTGVLGFNAGYVDTAGFLALNGLFSAHVTGNFVTLAAALVHGTAGALAKLAALPVFCLLVIVSRIAAARMQAHAQPAMRRLLLAKIVLLAAAAAVFAMYGPFQDSDTPWAFLAGMLLVAAMAVQNAVQRMHLASAPPSTLMTGTTTQIMIDLADLCRGASGEARAAALARLRKMGPAVLTFAAGCALAALAFVALGVWCFVLPPLAAVAAVLAAPGAQG